MFEAVVEITFVHREEVGWFSSSSLDVPVD
jgi:hypothetical protein